MNETPTTRFCLNCGYDLRSHADNSLCPECGTQFSLEEFNSRIRKPIGGSWKLLAPPVATVLAILLLHGLADYACLAHPLILMAAFAWGISIAWHHARWIRLASIERDILHSTGKASSLREHPVAYAMLEFFLILTAWLIAWELLLHLQNHYGLGPFILTT